MHLDRWAGIKCYHGRWETFAARRAHLNEDEMARVGAVAVDAAGQALEKAAHELGDHLLRVLMWPEDCMPAPTHGRGAVAANNGGER